MKEIMKREDVVEQMVEFELEHIEWDTVADILENGCLGVTNYSDEDLKAYYKDFFDEDIEFEREA